MPIKGLRRSGAVNSCRRYLLLKVTVTVDGSVFTKTLMTDHQLMNGSRLLVGGSEDTANITDGIMRNNFYGTIDKVSAVHCFSVLLSP